MSNQEKNGSQGNQIKLKQKAHERYLLPKISSQVRDKFRKEYEKLHGKNRLSKRTFSSDDVRFPTLGWLEKYAEALEILPGSVLAERTAKKGTRKGIEAEDGEFYHFRMYGMYCSGAPTTLSLVLEFCGFDEPEEAYSIPKNERDKIFELLTKEYFNILKGTGVKKIEKINQIKSRFEEELESLNKTSKVWKVYDEHIGELKEVRKGHIQKCEKFLEKRKEIKE